MEKVKHWIRSLGPSVYHLGHVAYFGLVALFAHGPYAYLAGGLMVVGLALALMGDSEA